jgi:hypothetical protein
LFFFLVHTHRQSKLNWGTRGFNQEIIVLDLL